MLASILAVLAASPELPTAAASQLVGQALTDGWTYARLVELTDRIGPRLSGSPQAEAAVQWALQTFRSEGLEAHLEAVQVPHWVRGVETGEILGNERRTAHPMSLVALGGSPGTSPEGVTGEVVEFRSFEQLAASPDRAKGKIVLFQHGMNDAAGYGEASELRSLGAVKAAHAGAVAMIVRSAASASFRSPHTGVTVPEPGLPSIPAAALSTEDAEMLHRYLAAGKVRVHLTLGCRNLPDVGSSNVVAEVKGRERPGEVVVFGAHLDSWDLATGAQDDGAGVAMVLEAARLIAAVRPAPRRTVRFVLFMNEENGLRGGKGYAERHAGELVRHVAAMEADMGSGRPLAAAVKGGAGAEEQLLAWIAPLVGLGVAGLSGQAGGADTHPMSSAHVPELSIQQDHTHYFDIHHSAADTLDKVEPRALAESAAAWTWLVYAAAESPRTLARPSLPVPDRLVAPAAKSGR